MINAKTIQLVPLRTPISNGALKADGLPNRLKLLGWGENTSVKGPVRVSELSSAVVSQNQIARGFAEIALDFEHNTVPGSPEYERSQEPRRVAAYGTPRVVPGEGLFMENLRWTPAGQSEALNFVDLSPAVEMDAQGNILFVHSAALTRNGAVEGLSFFNVQLNTKETMSDIKPENLITVAELAPVVGLSATASKADVLGKFALLAALSAAVTIRDNKLVAFSGVEIADNKIVVLDSLNEKITGIEQKVAALKPGEPIALTALSATVDGKTVTIKPEELVGRILKLETFAATSGTAAEDRARGELIARFSAEGKVPKGEDGKELSDAQLQTFSVGSLKLLLANTPATVPLSARGKKPAEGKTSSELKGLARAIAAHAPGN